MCPSRYKLAKHIACSVALACTLLGLFPFLGKAYGLVSATGEITVSSSVSLSVTPSEPSATSSERQLRSLTKDGRRPTVLGLITAFNTFVVARDRHYCPSESTVISLSAAHSLPNDRAPPVLFS